MCPKWDALKGLENRNLARLIAKTDWQPGRVWECGLLPSPDPGDCPPAPPSEADCDKPKQRKPPGEYLVFTDAPAMRPKDPYLRKAACAFWASDRPSDSAAWFPPEPVQTAYHAELFAILVALEISRGDLDTVSDCKRVVDEAEHIRAGGKASPTSRHADLWAKYRDDLGAGGLRRVRVRWVPSHEEEGSDRVSPSDRAGNDHADTLANAQAKRIGPTASQGKLYDRRAQQMCAIHPAQDPTVPQATDPPKAQDQPRRGPRVSRGWNRPPACPRKCHLSSLECGKLKVWGPHLITSRGTEKFRCITCARVANHKKARYALKSLPRTSRAGLAGPLQPRKPKLEWNRANEARWRRQGESGHQAVRYNAAQHDAKRLCIRCGLHYVRSCDLRAKQCAGAPGSQAATKSIADALAGSPLTRRKMHAFAKHPSGSRPGATGARLSSDVLVLDPQVRNLQNARHGTGTQLPAEQQGLPTPRVCHGPGVAVQAQGLRDEAPGGPELGAVELLPRSQGDGPGPGVGSAAPTKTQGIRAFLGLGPSQESSGARWKAAKVTKTGKPARAKAKRTPRRSASQQPPGTSAQDGPSRSPAIHIHHWLRRTGLTGAEATTGTHGASGSTSDPPPRARPADGGAALGDGSISDPRFCCK